jgi:ribosome-associated toxin RatA of RatAB toxin-antitoxin module
MPEVHRFALVPYTPEQMYDLVRDVARYPDFLDWVRSAEVHDEDGGMQLATLEVRLGGLMRRFTTRNELVPGERLSMRLQQGPFDQLSGQWLFVSLGGGTKVSLDLTFRLPGSMLLKPFQRNFGRMADRMVDDFSRRAETIYG